jgi:GT2 family glycosyltransferase
LGQDAEVIVVDASEGRLDQIREHYEGRVTWLAYKQPFGVRTTIPHQRNVGVRAAHGNIIVFTDAGCIPEDGWLEHLTSPLAEDEWMTYGLTLGTLGGTTLHDRLAAKRLTTPYLTECATINTAFRRAVYDAVDGFDETFAYGSDIDFSWRAVEAGFRIFAVPKAVVRHDWGSSKRQMRRTYAYGKARVHLYRKHPSRLRRAVREDPMVVVYPLFLLGLPITFIFPLYPALLLILAWRNRQDGGLRTVIDHLVFGLGVLVELIKR